MNKQEKVVCTAIYVMNVRDDYKGTRIVKGVNYEDIRGDGLVSEISHPIHCNMLINGFATNKNRFVDSKEAKKISVYNDNRVDYGIYKEMERLRKEIAKANNKRNRGDLSVELSLNILMNKYSELEAKLNEFRSRDYLLPEDLY